MATLIVHGVDQKLMIALQSRAHKSDCSVQQVVRTILEQELVPPKREPLAAVLMKMPDVGCDQDFERT